MAVSINKLDQHYMIPISLFIEWTSFYFLIANLQELKRMEVDGRKYNQIQVAYWVAWKTIC